MAKGKKTGGKDWEAGVSANPQGRTPLPEDVRIAKTLSQTDFQRFLLAYINLTPEQLKRKLEEPATSMLEHFVGSVLQKGVLLGDMQRLNLLLDRLVGKVQQTVELKSVTPFIVEKLSGDQVVMGTEEQKEGE